MKRLTIFFAIIVMAALLLAGCDSEKTQAPPVCTGDGSGPAPATETPSADNVSWSGYFGALTRRDSSQFNNATLQVKFLDDLLALFEIDMMEGSES